MKSKPYLAVLTICFMFGLWFNGGTLQAAELKDEVIKELASDLTELNRMIQPKVVATAKNFKADTDVLLSAELFGISSETISGVLNKIKQMYTKYAGKGVVIKGFSLNLGAPPSVAVNFEFE